MMINISTGDISEICRRWQIRELCLFGSALRHDFRADSDIDLLVTFERGAGWSTLDLADLKIELEACFGRAVDLVEKSTVRNPFRRRKILANNRVLYAA